MGSLRSLLSKSRQVEAKEPILLDIQEAKDVINVNLHLYYPNEQFDAQIYRIGLTDEADEIVHEEIRITYVGELGMFEELVRTTKYILSNSTKLDARFAEFGFYYRSTVEDKLHRMVIFRDGIIS